MTDPDFANKASEAVENTRKVNTNLMNKSEEFEGSLSLNKEREQPLDLSRVEQMQTEQAARATMPDDDSGVADLAVQAYADARKQIGDEVSKQMADDKSMAFVHPVTAGILRSAESMKAGDVQKTFDRMLENNAVRQAIETKANSELTAELGKNPALTKEQQKDIYNKSVQRQIDAISGRVNQYLLDVNAPKGESEYVLKSAVGNSLIGKSMLQAARNISGMESAEYDYGQQALADYDANKASWYAKGGAAIGGLLLDAPMMQGIGSASSAVLGRGTSMALGKAASNTLWGKMLIGQATAAGTLGGYNFTSTLASQMMGGHFDAGELFGSTLHGVGLGALTGGMTPLLRGATAGMGAVGKTTTMGGGILGEAAAFSAPEWVETFNENPYDFKSYAEALGTNVMVIAGLKASNLPKTVQEYKEWWNQGKTSGFTDADYKALSDYALAKGYANDGAFTYQDGVYQRSMADRATGGRNILTMTKLEGGKERNLAMEMYQDPNVPLSMKTKIAAKMGLPAPNPVLPNAVEARDNVVNTYYEYREQMSDGTYVTRRILVDSKEMPSKRKARAAASEFGRTKARQNSIIQSEAEANTDATNAIVMARLTEQAWRSGTNVSDEVARMYDIAQRAQRGEASAEDIAYYQSVMEGSTEVTDNIKADIKAKTGVDIDEVLKQEGTFNTAQDKALTMYSEALASLKDSSKPTTERGTTASQASVADYIELKGMGIEQTKQLLNDPTAKVAAEKEIRNKYALWLKYFDGQMSEEQLATRLGYNLDNTKGLMDFVNEEAFFRGKAANRIAYNAANAAKRLLEQGSGGVRFTEDGKVKLQGVPYSIAVDESIVDRYRAAQQGSGENYQRIANDALKDIIKQSETPAEPKEPIAEEMPDVEQPMTEAEAVTQQMVDARLAEIDTDLQGIEADGIQRVNINDKPAMIVKGRIAYISNGEIDRANSSTEVAYIPLDENGRPIKNEQGKPVVEVGIKPSNVRISEVEPWRTIEDYKRAEEQRIRDNNRITDEAMRQVDEQTEVENQVPTEPKTADDLLAMCDGDKALALDVATDELAKAMQAKGKGATPAETIEINRRIRMYQQMVDRLSATEQPDAATLPEAEQTSEATKAEPQVTEDMEFVYQKDLGENHEGMEPMQMADGRYKWVGLQRGELTATMGERDVELLDGLAKKLGVAVIPINVADSAVNGYYRDGNIYVNTNRGAEWTMRWVAGHEMLHDVAKKSPEAYDAYKQAVLDMWGSDYIDDQVKQIIDDYAASGKTIDREQALTELVNDFGGELFNSRDGLNILNNILKGESRKGNTGFVETIKQWWEKLKEWFSGTPYYKNVEKLLKDAYSEAIANAEEFRRNQEMDKGVSSVTDAARVEGAAIDFSIKTEPQVAQRLREYAETEDGKKHGWNKETIEGIINETEDLIDVIHNSLQGNQRYDAWADKNPTMRVDWRDGELKQTVTWSRGNIEYKYDMSADLLCINNEALEDVLASPSMVRIIMAMDALSKNGFTSDDYLRIYQVLRDKGFVVPCAGCFDAAARFKMLPSVAKNFADLVNKIVDERNANPEAFDAEVKAMAKGETTIEGLPTSAKTKEIAIRIGVAGDKLTEHIKSEQLMSAQGQTDMLATLGGIFRAWQRTGAGRPKDKLLPEPYMGDINNTTTTIIGKYGEKTPSYRDIYVNQGTGLRRNSHSEFRPLLAIDEIQFMRDAFAKGLTVFKYMKELDDVRLFGNMGVKFNMSFFPAFVKDGVAAGLDANGNYIASEESVGSREFAYMGEDGRTHFDGMKGWQEAQKYTNENVSLSSVVFSVPHLIKSLTDVPTPSDKSGMWGSLIPFHSTGATSAHLALQGLGRARANGIGHPFSEAMHDYNKGVTNFEDVQNDRFGEGWVIVEGKKAGTAIKGGHKLEFVNGTHMYNERLGVHLFEGGYIFDKDIKKKDNYGNGKVNTKNVKKYMTKFYIDYNDKARELGGDYAYKDAADYYLRELPKIGLIPRFSFEVPEGIYLEMCKAVNVDPKHPKLGWKGEGNAWNPIDAESYYSLFCDYGMTDPKTGKWSPHKPIGNIDENGNRVFRLPDNAVQIVKDAVDKYSARRDKEESRINGVYEEYLKRSVKDGRMSETEAQNLLLEISANAEFSIKADKELEKKSLVGVHNLTEDNLRYALNLGGLANPSTAVIDKNIMGLEGFGDISLIMPKSLVAKSTGKNAGTFAGDAYTPRFPKGDVVKYITKEGEKAIRADYPGDDKFSKDFREAWQSYGNEYGGITPALYYMYKLENGGAKIVKAEAPKIKSKEHQRMIDKFGNKEWYELNDAEKRELVDYRKSEMIESLKGADKNMVDKVVNDFINSADPEDLAYKKLRMLKMDYKEQQKAGEIDYMATYRNAQDDVALAGEQAKFNKWLADKSKRYGIEDRIFRGYTSSGNRKYAPMTLANISKVMKEQGRAGAETFMAKSAYSLRGKMLPVYKTLEQIKKNKSKLADTETYEKFRKEIGDEYNELILDISELPNVEYDDTHYILEDALLKGFDYAEKQAGIQISKAVRERISAFGNLLKEAPVKYFETKFERPVMFDEFVAAVVPKNINPELRKALADKGLVIEEYERGSEESRLEAVRRASDRDDVQFSVKGKRADESVLDYAKRMSEETGKKNLLNGGSYFSGGGLLEEGLKGIVNPTIAVEFNQKVAGVYRNNFGEHIVTADVRDVDPAKLIKDIDGPVAYFHASPVCKNFSNAKRNAEELPLDKETAQSTAKFIGEVRPKIVTIENVKGYRGSDAMKIILDELKKQGYNYDVDVYNAADYGAYTSRERLIVRAVRDWPLPPKPIKMLADERPNGWYEAVADIIDELPQAKNGVADWMDTRLKAMGIDYRNIDKPLYIFGSGYAKDKIGHAFADELVPTLRTKGGDVIVMPDGRVLKATPRVLARISGMSDDYTMPKSDDLAHTVVGNGIPVQLTKAVMGSLIENVKSDLDSGATEYSIIGKRGAANLDKRDESGIRADNLATAEDMEKAGKDAKTIRMATGWERGADGKWRYEVKDLVMLPAEQWIGKRGKKLSDIVENADELFAAYPELAKVKIKEGNGKTYGGSYSSGVITLDTYLAKLWMKRLPDSLPRANKYMNEALIHEIQHYIQEEEGFARGGNESMVLDKDAVSKISALIDDSNKLATQYNNMIESGVYEGREAVKDEIIALRAKVNAIRNSNRLGYDGYKRLAGEVEARNAEKRLGMTEEERKNSLLADTEDVGRDEQIVYGNTDDEYSIKIRGKEYRNDGYTQREDGTNVSIRALDAEESGTHSKGNFIKAYKVAKKDFDLLASLGVIKNTEWHHTGTNFAKTDFYSWADSQKADGNVEYGELAEIDPNSMAELYKKNKKEIGQLTDEYNNAKWGPLAKEREKLPTIEYITERYIRVSNPEKYSLSDWLTKEEKNSKSAEHEEISRGGEAYGTSYERRQMHEGVDNKYNKIAYDRKKEWAESHKDDIRRRYDEIAARVEKYNAEILPLEDVFANDAKGKPLMKLLEMFGYSADDAAKKIYHLQYQYYSNTIDERMAEASEKVRKEYDVKIESARVDFNKWLSKALKDGKAEFVERVPSEPENFITTKEEMNGRYGWFEASSRYNLPRYYSGYKFKTKRMYDSYKKREEDIFKIELEQISKTQEASNNVYNEYLKASHAVREDLVEKPLVQGDYSIKGGNTPKKQVDEVARLKQKIEQLSQEKDAIAEDGAKVKDIASEMTNFIKQNISTEIQSDMTRNQFKGILNQLENAVTKKDLEKPMQMVEYIGTNVTRRSLTRQMRNFLNSEFKSMTPQGAVKAKTVDGATSRVLELAKTMYATMNKLPLGGEVAALQKQMRDLKADATEWVKDQNVDTQNLLADVLKMTERPAATRYNELAELRNKVAADGSASGEMLGYIDHMLGIMGDIDYFRGEQQKAKEASALNSKEDLEALKSELLDKSDKGILSEEDKAVLDNMPLYEMMVNLRQRQLDIDGGGAASIDAQIRNKQNAIKAYRAKMNELPKTDTTGRERYKALIEQVGGEIDDLFASRIVDQKAVNNGMRELIDDLVTLKEQGHSRLVEWSKGKQERSNGIRKLANDSFSSTARGYWDEVNKKGHRLRDINNFLNNAKLTVISPALSFEYMLGTLDKKYYTNDSPIYNRFIKSQDGLLKANDNFFEGLESYNKEVNEAANRLIGRGAITDMAEWFKLGDRFVTEEIPFAFEVDQMFDDGTVRKVTKGITATMTRGQAAKIYAWSRMADGMAKLKAHGVTDETLAAVKDFIGEGYMRFVDWVEDDFFPRLRREKYDLKYKEIYGISMAENEHYFPFAIYKKDVRTNTDLEQIGDDKLGGGLVGNLIERKRNNARLDFTRKSPDIFDMITRYGETMEEWAAYAQVREDLKAMVNDKQFKVKCDMFGTDYYKHFLEAARVASRTSDDKALAGKWNTSMGKLQKVLASAAISMRVSTALKQLLSAPAFAVYSLDPKFLHQLEKTVVPIDVESAIKGLLKIGSGDLKEAKKLLLNENWVGHYNWCVNNLPSFRERVSLGGAGNPILEEKSFDNFFGKLCDAVQSAGMIPNRLVDAFTCSLGAKAIYEYNFNKYKKMYGEKAAHNMAVTEAEIAFNSSQQSSNPVFLSPMQVTKQFFVRGLMNFKNAPIGYLRAGLKANIDIVRAIKSIYNPTFKVDGQEMRFNSNGKNAASMLMTAAARSAMYNFFLNFIWNFGVYGIAGLSYTAKRNLFGEGDEDGNLLYSDEEWKKATCDNLASTLFLCATQGLPYISGPFATAEQGTEFAPLMLLNTLNEMGTDIYQSGLVSPVAAQWITNIALKFGVGIDPQVCARVYEGLQGILADRPVTEEDIMNLLASPDRKSVV